MIKVPTKQKEEVMKYLAKIIFGLVVIITALVFTGCQKEKPCLRPEKAPEFQGGSEALLKYLMAETKYPQLAKESKIEGKVFVQFVVEKDGEVTEAKVLRGIGYGCDEEALRVVSGMSKWKPAEDKGKIVRSLMVLPFQFKLE
jgi:protein TonB